MDLPLITTEQLADFLKGALSATSMLVFGRAMLGVARRRKAHLLERRAYPEAAPPPDPPLAERILKLLDDPTLWEIWTSLLIKCRKWDVALDSSTGACTEIEVKGLDVRSMLSIKEIAAVHEKAKKMRAVLEKKTYPDLKNYLPA